MTRLAFTTTRIRRRQSMSNSFKQIAAGIALALQTALQSAGFVMQIVARA